MLHTDEDGGGERQVHTSFHAVGQGKHQVQDHLEGLRLFLWMYCCMYSGFNVCGMYIL